VIPLYRRKAFDMPSHSEGELYGKGPDVVVGEKIRNGFHRGHRRDGQSLREMGNGMEHMSMNIKQKKTRI